ncbi:hypothetical protein ACODM8_14405 [Vibrio ostreicida]|uniref:hypothetical protein n=1 Tax=Vibrio ostreicida TaxID=526588 RepID=UPI003B5902BA
MGSKSSSSSSTNNHYTTTNTSGTAATSGDNHGTMLSGVNGSTITLTDHGSVNQALAQMYNVTDEALDFGDNTIKSHENVLDKALKFGKEAMQTAQGATDSALDVAKNLSLDSDAATARDTNKNMMYTTVAIAVALAVVAMRKE